MSWVILIIMTSYFLIGWLFFKRAQYLTSYSNVKLKLESDFPICKDISKNYVDCEKYGYVGFCDFDSGNASVFVKVRLNPNKIFTQKFILLCYNYKTYSEEIFDENRPGYGDFMESLKITKTFDFNHFPKKWELKNSVLNFQYDFQNTKFETEEKAIILDNKLNLFWWEAAETDKWDKKNK